mgnify:CR=1 FL=1
MKVIFDITRRKYASKESYQQRIPFETEDCNETVATALLKINTAGIYYDEDGKPVEQIQWEAGCLQKKCGACAMLINGYPGLACDTFLWELCGRKRIDGATRRELRKPRRTPVVTLAPLSKFPVISDLVTDRSVMFSNLKTLQVWGLELAEIKEKDLDQAYDASRCLQCGCCLEACPNFYPGGAFCGAAGFAPEARLLSTYSAEEKAQIQSLYRDHVYEGCGKSLACAKVCPAQLDLDRLMSRSNAAIIWRRKR